jgi:hypothetical protein
MSDDEFVIFPPFETFYIISLLSCTESALISAEWVSRYLQNIALQGAAISRFFWPIEEIPEAWCRPPRTLQT